RWRRGTRRSMRMYSNTAGRRRYYHEKHLSDGSIGRPGRGRSGGARATGRAGGGSIAPGVRSDAAGGSGAGGSGGGREAARVGAPDGWFRRREAGGRNRRRHLAPDDDHEPGCGVLRGAGGGAGADPAAGRADCHDRFAHGGGAGSGPGRLQRVQGRLGCAGTDGGARSGSGSGHRQHHPAQRHRYPRQPGRHAPSRPGQMGQPAKHRSVDRMVAQSAGGRRERSGDPHLRTGVDAMPGSLPLIRNISDTALWVAYYRALESERPDGLFRDPYARQLAGERGAAIAASQPFLDQNAWSLLARTYLFDQFIHQEVALGADLVVNLAAGLDARPYRMSLPATLHWIEVDLPAILDYKEEVLSTEKPGCM